MQAHQLWEPLLRLRPPQAPIFGFGWESVEVSNPWRAWRSGVTEQVVGFNTGGSRSAWPSRIVAVGPFVLRGTHRAGRRHAGRPRRASSGSSGSRAGSPNANGELFESFPLFTFMGDGN